MSGFSRSQHASRFLSFAAPLAATGATLALLAFSNGCGNIEQITPVGASSPGPWMMTLSDPTTASTAAFLRPDSNTGLLTNAGSSITVGSSLTAAVATHGSAHVYIAGAGTKVYTCGFSLTSGLIACPTSSDLGASADPRALGIDPIDRYLYAANFGTGSVSMFTIAASSGAITEVAGSPFAITGGSPAAIAVDPSGYYVYVTNFYAGTITGFSVDTAAHSLTTLVSSPFTVGASTFPMALAITPDGKFLYAGTRNPVGGFSVYGYAINALTGELSPLGSSPYAGPAQVGEKYFAMDPQGKYLYMATAGTASTLSVYAINATTGALTSAPGSPHLVGNQPIAVLVTGDGSFVYVANHGAATISEFSIDRASGALTTLRSPAFSASVNLKALVPLNP